MKILILAPNAKERGILQQTAVQTNHQPVIIETSEQAWRMIETGQSQFVVADWDTSDVRPLQFISRVRKAKGIAQVYILIFSSKASDNELAASGANDYLRKPFTELEFRSRVTRAERLLSMSSNLAAAREQLENAALYDDLTGFLNRVAFQKQAAGELERARRGSVPFCMISLDVENLPEIVERHGRETGENILRIVAQAIREKCRPYDCVSRWSGNGFLLALSGIIGADAEKVAGRIIKSVELMNVSLETGEPINPRLTVGIAAATTVTAAMDLGPLILKARQAIARSRDDKEHQVFIIYE